jgi:hypothetical protein
MSDSEKVVRITHEDGTIWTVDAVWAAKRRAYHYVDAESSGGEKRGTDFEEEVEFGLNNDFALTDFLANNMHWEDIKPHAEKIGEIDRPSRKMYTADLTVTDAPAST